MPQSAVPLSELGRPVETALQPEFRHAEAARDGTRLELSSFVRPDSVPGSPAAIANELGLRNVAFEVNDLQAAVDWAATEGYGLVGWHRRVRGRLADGLRPGAGRDHRLAGRAHRLSLATPASAADRVRTSRCSCVPGQL
jgi:hypothetical protein